MDFSYVTSEEMSIIWFDSNSDTLHPNYSCPQDNVRDIKCYTSCNEFYYLAKEVEGQWIYNKNTSDNCLKCIPCPDGYKCDGDTDGPEMSDGTNSNVCGEDYAGSLYQKTLRYAMQVCARPSELQAMQEDASKIPSNIMQDVNMVMDTVKSEMATHLAAECERLGGVWINTPYDSEKTTNQRFTYFYDETGANTKWGYCATKESVASTISG